MSEWLLHERRLHRAVGAHLDVRGLQIAVDDPLLVRGFECFGNLSCDRESFINRYRPPSDSIRERFALNELENKRAFFEAVDRSNVRVVQRGKQLRFAFESCKPIGIRRVRLRQDLDSNITLEARIAGAVHLL